MYHAAQAIAVLMILGGSWAFIQSPSGTQFPIPIAVGGFVILIMLSR